MLRKLMALSVLVSALVFVVIGGGLFADVAPASATNVNLYVTCKYHIDGVSPDRDCENKGSTAPEIEVGGGGIYYGKQELPAVYSIAPTTVYTMHLTNSWHFGCTYNEQRWYWDNGLGHGDTDIHVGTKNVTRSLTFTCPYAYEFIGVVWQTVDEYQSQGHFYALESTVMTLTNETTSKVFTPTVADEYGLRTSGFGDGNSAWVWGIQRLTPGRYKVEIRFPSDHPGCWLKDYIGYHWEENPYFVWYRYFNVTPQWVQHYFDSPWRFLRYDSPAYCENEPS